MVCEQGDVVSLDFDPSRRHEPAGRSCAVVVSPWEVNRMCSLTTVAPITSRGDGYPLHVPIAEGNDVRGFVQCEALRAMDLGVREREGSAEVVCRLDDATMADVMARVAVVLGLDRRRW